MERKQKWKLWRRREKAVMAVLLSVLLLFQTGTAFATTGAFSSHETAGEEGLAATVSGNESAVNEEPESGEIPEEEPADDLEAPGENVTASEEEEDTVSGQNLPEIQAGEVTGPANPVHHCTKKNDGSDYTDFSYVYFGSYPKSEVTDSATIAAIDKEIAVSGVSARVGTDVWVNGIKYRRISKRDTTYREGFDAVPNNGYRYFKWERIKWRVLKNDGNTLFVVTDEAIDCRWNYYYGDGPGLDMHKMGHWLEYDFYDTAFSSNERSAIVEKNVEYIRYEESGIETKYSLTDVVYLLSKEEVTNTEYGFCNNSDFASPSRRMKSSDYANAQGAYDDDCNWWLRTPISFQDSEAYTGGIRYNGSFYEPAMEENERVGVCPALNINLSSSVWFEEDDGTSGEGGGSFSYVYFGSYPQSEVTDSATIAAIDKEIAASGAAADAGMDVWINGTKYRRISKGDMSKGYNVTADRFDEVPNNGYRYFKWNRIKWRVLENNGKTLFVVADKALDCQQYNEKNDSTWEKSTIRNWLNTSFYHTAFSSKEQNAIVEQTVVNMNKEGGQYDTNDKVYLLSQEEVRNEKYGFFRYGTESASRIVKANDYAKARGLYTPYESNHCEYWSRSEGNFPWSVKYIVRVRNNGDATQGGPVKSSSGVRPALHINLSSSLWVETDDGTSGSGGEEKGGKVQISQKVQKLTIKAPSKKLAAGKKVKLTLKVAPENAADKAVKWKSSNQKYATVDKNGKITLKKKGIGKKVTITATAQDGSGKKASIKIKIMKHAVKTIKLKAPKKTLKAGKSMTIKDTIKTTGKNANKSLKWTSSNKKYATVNSKGKVTAKKAGKGKTVTITAKATDGSNKKATVQIKIK